MTGITASRSIGGPDGPCRFEPGRDLRAVVALLEAGFQDDLDERDRRWLRDLSTLSGAGPALDWMMRLLPRAETGFCGMVWYEDGRLVANVSLIRRPPDIWTIANVVTHPSMRRRGIAVRLMDAALALATERGAARVQLHVRPDNEPALALYDRLGFLRGGRTTTLRRSAGVPAPAVTATDIGFSVQPWRQPRDARAMRLMTRAGSYAQGIPGELLVRSADRGKLRLRFDDWLHGRSRVGWAVSTGATYRAVSLVLLQQEPGLRGIHRMAVVIDPAWQGRAEEPLIARTLESVARAPKAPVEIEVAGAQEALRDVLVSAGFESSRTLQRLTKDLPAT